MLGAAALVATIWLWLDNQLILYIHPRYIVFTVVMSALALVFVVASVALVPSHRHTEPESRTRTVLSAAAGILAIAVAAAMIIVPPATLTSATVAQRDINGSGAGAEVRSLDEADSVSAGAFATFTVQDWASLLRQSSDVGFFADKPVDVVGFVTEDADAPDDVFYVSRFVITCCAVDAQPVGIPVYSPGWRDSVSVDDWVQVTGRFVANPSTTSTQQTALDPAAIVAVGQPAEPYLF